MMNAGFAPNPSAARRSRIPGGPATRCASHVTRHVLLLLFVTAFFNPAQAQQAGLLREFFGDIAGNSVADLTGDPTYPDRPTRREVLTDVFETGPDEADNYGQRIRGYLDAPESGDYVFWVSSDDQSVLYLSTDEDATHKRAIATVNGATGFRDWFAEPNQQSLPIRLEAGRLYYVEALMKEGVGGDHLSVRWSRPQGGLEEPVPASNFLPFGTALFAPEITRQPASVTVAEGEPASFRVEVRNADPVAIQWQRDDVAIPGATGSILTLPRVSRADDGARFRCTLSNEKGVIVSEEALLHVRPDTVPPGIAAVFNASLGSLVVRFTEPVSTNTALIPGNYRLDPGATVTSTHPGASPTEIVLDTSPLTPRTDYTLTVSGVTDTALSPNPVAAGTSYVFTVLTLVPAPVGSLSRPADVQPMPGGLDITSVGRGLAGTNDQAHFSYETRTGDFNVQVRVDAFGTGGPFAQAGLLARQDLTGRSPFAATIATPGMAGAFFSWRSTTGAVAQSTGSFPVNYPQTWLRLQRAGTNVTGYASDDGAVWSRLGTAAIGLSNTVYLGLVVASRSTNQTATAAFRDYGNINSDASPAVLPEGIEPLGPSSRRTGLVISEIMYHPPGRDDGRRTEFIELFNSDSTFVDLAGFRLSGDVDYTFPTTARIPAGGFLVVAQAPEDLSAIAGITGVLGPWKGQLPHDGGTVRLRNRSGAVLLEVAYSDEPPWPAAADGAGHSLVLARPSYGEGDWRAWGPGERRGGSPGRLEPRLNDPFRRIVINEVLAHTDEPVLDFVELYNRGTRGVDVSGCILTDDPLNARFRVPAGTVLPPGGFVAWDQAQLGFALSAAGEAVYLLEPDEGRVVDAVRFGPQLNGVSTGRVPNGADAWRLLAAPSRGTPNGPPRQSAIVINEIMYHPPGGSQGEFVELYNRSAAPVDLRDWRFVDGITFAFTNDVVVPPGGFHVVAANRLHLLSVYTNLAVGTVSGDFEGGLANGGEHLALARPETWITTNSAGRLETNRIFVTVNEVSYRDGGRWGRWADGGGSSLELTDPRADTQLAASWADSDESAKATWTTVEDAGLLELGQGDAGELHVMLLGEGECLLDNVEVRDQSGANLVSNPTFEGGLSGWIAQGNHVSSGLSSQGDGSQHALQVRATAGGDNGANRVKTVLANGSLVSNAFATFRASARWLHGDTNLLLRLKGNWLEKLVELPRPENLGTPGVPNSRLVANAGPAVYDVAHAPVLPAALEPVKVTARVHDPDGIAGIKLKFRYDPSVSIQELPMHDDGKEGDALAGDGLYTASLPGQAAGVLIAFWVEATDAASPPVHATFPAEPSRGECLVRFGDAVPSGSFGTYRMWMTQRNTDTWTQREVLSNEPLDGTMVYGSVRAIYNAGSRYRGSPWIRPGYDGPTGALCAYVWTLPKDEPLLGSDEFNLDWLEQPGRDPTLQRERVSFWIGNQLGVPFSHQRYVQIFFNGVRRGEVYADSQQPNADYVASWFPDHSDGEIFKIDDWFEFDASVNKEFNVDGRLQEYDDARGQPHKTRYRWNWEKKANGGIDDDYSHLMSLVEAVNLPDGDLYTQSVQDQIDLDGWMRTIATRRVVADWDGYGYSRGKNSFAYLPPGGRWHLLLWDLDFSLGGGSDNPTTGIYTAEDPIMQRMYRHPYFGRVYLQAISDAVRGPLAQGAADPLIDANYAAFLGNGINVAAPDPIKSWIAERRRFLAGVLLTNTAPWSIAGSGADPLPTADSVVTLTGTAPIDVRSIEVNGILYAPSWTAVTNWVLRLPVRAGINHLALRGVDRVGQAVPGAAGNLDVEYTGEDERPEDFIRFSEILYEPEVADAEFVEIHNGSTQTTFDLSGWRVSGIDFDFPGGVSIAPGAFLLLVKDREVFESVYGMGLPVAGEYPGRLNNAGETLRLSRPGTSSQPLVPVNEVTYDSRLPWSIHAMEGGSLQVLDGQQDNRRPANWMAVDGEGHGYSQWRFVSVTDRATSSLLRISLGRPSQVHIDDISLVAGLSPRVGTELVVNGGFEAPLETGWTADPGLTTSAIDTAVRRSGLGSLRLVASPEGFRSDASIRQTLTTPVVAGEFYTLSFWYLPDRSGSELTVRLDGDGVATSVDAAEAPVAAATPGAPSSVKAALAPIPDLWINEVYPGGLGGTEPPWIELYNAGASQVSLSGWFLSPDPGLGILWPMPASAAVGPGGFLVVQADGQSQSASGLHASFALTPGSGSVILARNVNGSPAAIDYLHYDHLAAGRATGSYPDGAWSERQILEIPTPGAPNDISSVAVNLTINEWMARNTRTLADPADDDYDDWFELYNGGSEAVDLGGYSLTDDPADPRKSVIPAGFVLAPQSAMLVWADGETRQNGPGRALHADFSLSFSGDTIALFSPGGAIIDLVTFGPQERDISEGLVPDGAVGTAMRLATPSPGATNGSASGAEVRLTAIHLDGSEVTLTWSATVGATYRVQVTGDLAGAWADLNPPVTASGPSAGATDASAGDAAVRFYRVIRTTP